MTENRVSSQFVIGTVAQASGPNATASVTIGLTPEQVREMALAITRQESAAQGQLEILREQFNTTRSYFKTLRKTIMKQAI